MAIGTLAKKDLRLLLRDPRAMVILLAVWLFCSNVMMLVGYKVALRRARPA